MSWRMMTAKEAEAEYLADLKNQNSKLMRVRKIAREISDHIKSSTTLPDQCPDEVKLHAMGENLGRVKWKGRQWAVTSYGLERRDGCYGIEKRDFFDGHPWAPSPYHGWMEHIGHKASTDIEDLRDALIAFALIHGKRKRKRGAA